MREQDEKTWMKRYQCCRNKRRPSVGWMKEKVANSGAWLDAMLAPYGIEGRAASTDLWKRALHWQLSKKKNLRSTGD